MPVFGTTVFISGGEAAVPGSLRPPPQFASHGGAFQDMQAPTRTRSQAPHPPSAVRRGPLADRPCLALLIDTYKPTPHIASATIAYTAFNGDQHRICATNLHISFYVCYQLSPSCSSLPVSDRSGAGTMYKDITSSVSFALLV